MNDINDIGRLPLGDALRKMAELIREQGEKITRLEQHEIRRLKLEREAQRERDAELGRARATLAERDRTEGYR